MPTKITCSICGNPLVMNNDGQSLSCIGCGVIYPISMVNSMALLYSNTSNQQYLSSNTGIVGVSDNSSINGSTTSQYNDQAIANQINLSNRSDNNYTNLNNSIDSTVYRQHTETSTNGNTTKNTATASSDTEETTNLPLTDKWKTSSGFAFLGVIANFAIQQLFILLGFIGVVVGFCWGVIAILYAAVIYPTFFTDNTQVHSNKTASFLNTFFGGIIFGCLWNTNLTNDTRGISHIIYTILNIILAIFIAIFPNATEQSFGSSTQGYSKQSQPFQRIKTVSGNYYYSEEDGNIWISNSIVNDKDKVIPEQLIPVISEFTSTSENLTSNWFFSSYKDGKRYLSADEETFVSSEFANSLYANYHRESCPNNASHVYYREVTLDLEGHKYRVDLFRYYVHKDGTCYGNDQNTFCIIGIYEL